MSGVPSGPPPAVERWVRRLTPPACREEVLGDLAERCASSREYLRDALRTLPFVIGSRIRRTTHPLGVLIVGAFLWWAIFFGNHQADWRVATIPTVLMLVVFALRDAWRPQTLERMARTVALDIAWVAAAVLLTEAALWRWALELLLNRVALRVGFPAGLLILYFLRLQSPTGLRPPSAWHARAVSLADLRTGIAAGETMIRRAVAIEIGACAFVAAVLPTLAALAHAPPVLRIGFFLVAPGAAFVAAFLWRNGRVRPIPADLDFNATVQRCRAELQRRRRLSRSYLWWYILPLAAGPVGGIIGLQLQRQGGARGALMTAAVVALAASVLTLVQFIAAAMAQKRIDQLALVTEKGAA